MLPPVCGDAWVGLSADPLPVIDALAWTVAPSCGAQVLFTGTVRDNADGREGVVALTYEAYEEQAAAAMARVVGEARVRWPAIGRVAVLHRIGRLALGDVAVAVVVAAPHRDDAFHAARHCIDTLKATVPIWKYEEWADGADWGTRAVALPEMT